MISVHSAVSIKCHNLFQDIVKHKHDFYLILPFMRKCVMTGFYHYMVLQAWTVSAELASTPPDITPPFSVLHTYISLLPTELWL